MSEGSISGFRERATDAANRETFASHRDLLGAVVVVGDVGVAIGIPIALRGHGSTALLAAWGALVIISSYGWEVLQRLYPNASRDNEILRDKWGWVATSIWAALPWLVIDGAHLGSVAWILVFVVVFAVGSDMLFLSQSDAPSLDLMVLTYVGSFLLAFGMELQLLPIGATVIAAASFIAAARVWSKLQDELIEKRVESEQRARIDSLTGLATRAAAAEAVATLIDSGAEVLHCAFVDIDDFKHLNDNHGYSVGDDVLIAVGALLAARIPDGWTIARFGGDEFVAVGAEPVDFDDLIETDLAVADHATVAITQSLSIGATAIPAERATVDALFREAAAALRFAKRLGKRQVLHMTDELRALEESKIALGGRAGMALDNGEITAWAQTIVDLRTEEPVGIELLARWEQPDGTIVSPADFIPVIEDQGRGPALGLLMITRAIETLAEPTLRTGSTFVTVNVSARHLYHRRLPAEILALLGRHGVAADRLVLEITESQHLPSSPIWQETADQLRALGIGLAMDDFGTGYSSMEQLLEVPFTHVKLDRLITQAMDRPGATQLAGAIAAMVSGAGMTSIAEGIETERQRAAMRDVGYRFGQGFLFHRPAPLAEVVQAIRSVPTAEARADQRS